MIIRNFMKYDYLIVGAGIYGSVFAREMTDASFKCKVIDKRKHIGGNCYTEKIEGINVHRYGPHIFHTDNKEIWDYVNRFVEFNNYKHHAVAKFQGQIYSLPFNMWTFNQLWGVQTPDEAKAIIDSQKFKGVPSNLEEQALSMVGTDVYEYLIKGYTEKQWMKSAKDLPPFIIKRLPVRYTFDNNYFFDKYQGIPINGYTELFEKLLDGIDIELNVDYLENRDHFNNLADTIVYTGPIDKFYDYKFGDLEYRPLRFENFKLEDTQNYQGHTIVNYTDINVPYTRIVEHKHFCNDISDITIVTKEYPVEWKRGEEPYYPINDIKNQEIFKQYENLSVNEHNIIFGGRLAEYKYYDMHQVILSALNKTKDLCKKV